MKTPVRLILIIILLYGALKAQNSCLYKDHAKLKNEKKDTARVSIFFHLYEHYIQSNPDSAFYCLQQALNYSKKAKILPQMAWTYERMGSYYKIKGKIDSVKICFNEAVKLKEKYNDPIDLANTFFNYGIFYYETSEYENSMSFYLKALKIYEGRKYTHGLIITNDHLSLVHKSMGRMDDAVRFAKSAISIIEQNNLKEEHAATFTNYAILLKNLGQFDQALVIYDTVISITTRQEDIRSKSIALLNKAIILENTKRLKESEATYNLAFEGFKKINHIVAQATVLANKGSLYCKLNRYDEAIELFYKSNELAIPAKYKNVISSNYYNLAYAFYDKGDYKKGFEFYEKYNDLKDSMLNESNQKAIAEMTERYEGEKKQLEINTLNAQNQLKNAEVERQNIYKYAFAIGFVLMGGLAISILRGLIQKKKANAIIMQQKELVEEKQKEILDSIHYARRIQKALITSEFYINKELKKLK